MLLIDGMRYHLQIPKNEKHLESMIKEHAREIFGNDSIYFDSKLKLTSKCGIVSYPDGYVIILSDPFEWYIVEGELSNHPIHKHITHQLLNFMSCIKHLNTQKELADALYNEIAKDKSLKAYVEIMTGSPETKSFLYDLISNPPKIVVVIDGERRKVDDACAGLEVKPDVVEFKTYVREDGKTAHAHFFEPLYEEQTHAKYVKSENKFVCIVGSSEHNISRFYDAIGIVEHLNKEHQISPENALIEGWTSKFERQWKDYERKRKMRPKT